MEKGSEHMDIMEEKREEGRVQENWEDERRTKKRTSESRQLMFVFVFSVSPFINFTATNFVLSVLFRAYFNRSLCFLVSETKLIWKTNKQPHGKKYIYLKKYIKVNTTKYFYKRVLGLP